MACRMGSDVRVERQKRVRQKAHAKRRGRGGPGERARRIQARLLSALDVRDRFASSSASVHRYHRRRWPRPALSTPRRIRDGRAHPARTRSSAAAPQSSRRRASRIVSPGPPPRTSRAARVEKLNNETALGQSADGFVFAPANDRAHTRYTTTAAQHVQNGDTYDRREKKKIIKM